MGKKNGGVHLKVEDYQIGWTCTDYVCGSSVRWLNCVKENNRKNIWLLRWHEA